MQTLTQMRETLAAAGREPNRNLGQNFLIDANLMAKLIELAEVSPDQTVLEVGPATGSLTEDLLARAGRVVAVEFDSALADILQTRLGADQRLTVLKQDALAGKHQLAPEVLEALTAEDAEERKGAFLVANLPYNIAVPLVANCLKQSWQAMRGRAEWPVVFRRLTFTVQRELAERFLAAEGEELFGPVSVLVALLARPTAGRVLPPEAFWPRPKVHSQMVRLDFDESLAGQLADVEVLQNVLATVFSQRRKKISAAAKLKTSPLPSERFLAGLAAAGIDPDLRPQQVSPEAFRDLANFLAT